MAEQELEVNAPGGWGAKFKGDQMFYLVVTMLLGAFIGYMIYQNNAKATESITGVINAQAQLKASIDAQIATQKAMIYVLSLPQTEREKLNLLRPKELAEMQR